MIQRSERNKGQNFIRVLLQSGTGTSPLGEEELVIFCKCKCDCGEPSIEDVDIKGLVQWVNKGFKKNQSNDSFHISQEIDAISVIFLNYREIKSCHIANRIYPSEC